MDYKFIMVLTAKYRIVGLHFSFWTSLPNLAWHFSLPTFNDTEMFRRFSEEMIFDAQNLNFLISIYCIFQDSEICPHGWKYFPHTKLCYRLMNYKETWVKALDSCRRAGRNEVSKYLEFSWNNTQNLGKFGFNPWLWDKSICGKLFKK